ncbi:MAG: hypothetical protein LBP55_04150 [Candidatus Adiutrix sp.]|nr:hypothetical protein [Candidatus Adiutrix sp.]
MLRQKRQGGFSAAQIRMALVQIVAPPKVGQEAPTINNLHPAQAATVDQMLALVEAGAGADIAGVRGSA